MRCLSCDRELSDFEATRKLGETGEFLDLCNKCLSASDIEKTDDRFDLEGVGESYSDESQA